LRSVVKLLVALGQINHSFDKRDDRTDSTIENRDHDLKNTLI
jgi:hypothetical protein